MGNSDLRKLASINETTLDELSGSTIAVDAHHWLYRYLTTTVKWTDTEAYTTSNNESVANLIGLAKGLPKILEADITPVFVFDGEPPELKREEIEARKKGKKEAEKAKQEALDDGNYIEASKMESRSQRLTGTMIETSIDLLELLDIPVVQAPSEAEAQCAHMTEQDNKIDYASTGDYDALLYGSPLTIRQITSSGGIEVMDYSDTVDTLDITQEQLIDVAILCGTDYNNGVKGYGPSTSLDAIREHDDIWGVMEHDEDAKVENAEEIRNLLLNPDVKDPSGYSIEPDISDADISTAKEFVTEEWEVDIEEVEQGFNRIQDCIAQTGLDRWT